MQQIDWQRIDDEELPSAINGLSDPLFAAHCLELALQDFRSGRVRFWVPRFAIIAANVLGRANEVKTKSRSSNDAAFWALI